MKTSHSISWARKSVYSALVFFWTIIVLSVGYAAWNAAMSKVNSGNPLTATAWNALVDNIADLNNRWARSGSDLAFTGGSVGIGVASPGGKLDIAGTTLTNFLRVDSDRLNTNSYFSIGSYWADGVIRMNPGPASTIYINREVGVTRDLSIWNGNNTPIFYTQGATGNVWIGTTTPASKLDIRGGVILATPDYVLGAVGSSLGIWMGAASGNTYASLDSWVAGGTGFGNIVLHPTGNGNVWIGTTDPGYKLDVAGWVNASAGYTQVSDRRFKKDIQPITSALSMVSKLQGVTFDFRKEDFKNKDFPSGKQVGFIAQEVEKVIPEVVTTDKQGYKGVEYANITAVLVEAIKEQQRQIQAQQDQVNALQGEIRALRSERYK